MNEQVWRWSRPIVALPILACLTLALHAGTIGSFFVADDFDFLLWSQRMAGPLDAVRGGHWGEWDPAWYLSWYVDFSIWGLNPVGYRLTNIGLLVLCVLSLYGLVRTIWPSSPLAAWTAALLFLTHPVHDEAVNYLAARGHPMATGFALLALGLYARFRVDSGSAPRRGLLVAGALAAAFVAPLAKGVALMLPVGVVALEWACLDRRRSPARAVGAAAAAGVAFMGSVGAGLWLRMIAVGLESDKLRGVANDGPALFRRLTEELPVYALVGGLPLPFAFADYDSIRAAGVLGWALVGVTSGVAIAACIARYRSRNGSGEAAGLYLLGFGLLAASLATVFWADLPIRRRYLFLPSVGIVMIATATLERMARRLPRVAAGLLIAALVAGAGSTLYRNSLYARSGEAARSLIETARGAPLDRPAEWSIYGKPLVTLVTLPRMYGGDFLSGAYLFRHDDAEHALEVFDIPQDDLHHALKRYRADDYTALETVESAGSIRVRVGFETRRAFEAALERDPSEDRRGDVSATLETADPALLTLTYRVTLPEGFGEDPRRELFLYSDSRFRRVALMP